MDQILYKTVKIDTHKWIESHIIISFAIFQQREKAIFVEEIGRIPHDWNMGTWNKMDDTDGMDHNDDDKVYDGDGE